MIQSIGIVRSVGIKVILWYISVMYLLIRRTEKKQKCINFLISVKKFPI